MVLRSLAAAVAVAASLPASAGYVSEGGGSFDAVPMYRAFGFAGVDVDNNGAYPESDFDAIDYVSNVAPKPLLHIDRQVQAGAASFSGTAWSAWSGFYAARSYASMTVVNADPAQRYYVVAGQGSATSVQFFTPDAAASKAVFTWHVTGVESNPPGVGQATGRIDFAATTDEGRSWVDLFNGGFENQLFEYGTGTFTHTLPVTDLGVPIYLYYWSSAFVEYLGGQLPAGASFTATADYGQTVVLESVQLLDADDNPIYEWWMQDLVTGETVFDQGGRIAEVLPPPPVPEPGTWAMLAAGLIAIGRRLRHSRA